MFNTSPFIVSFYRYLHFISHREKRQAERRSFLYILCYNFLASQNKYNVVQMSYTTGSMKKYKKPQNP